MEKEMTYKFMTPVEVWQNFDPTEEELDAVRVRTVVKDGIAYESIYFTAKSVESGKVRVYAQSARPAKAKGKLPSLLLIPPKSDEEIDLTRYSSIINEGYTMLAIDYEGKKDKKLHYTLYPDELEYCNSELSGRHMFYAEPSAHDTVWYNWSIIARRAITLMNTLEYVDESKIVLMGESMGCPVVWQVAAQDKRLKGACTLFGYNLEFADGEAEERDCWLSGVDMRSYASYVDVPFLYIGATNAEDESFDTLLKISENIKDKSNFYTDFAFGYSNSITEHQIKGLFTFLDRVYDGEKYAQVPTLDVVANENGELVVEIKCDGARSADVLYAYGSEPEKRLWKKVEAKKHNGVFTTKLDLALEDEVLRIFGRANYNKFSVCSLSKVVVPSTIGMKCMEKRRTRVLYDSIIESHELLPISSELILSDGAVVEEEGAVGLKGVTTSLAGLAYVRDPEQIIEFATAESLQLEIFAQQNTKISVTIHTVAGKEYLASKDIAGGENWQKTVLPMSIFKDENFKKMTSWDGTWRIDITGLNGAVINKILLV